MAASTSRLLLASLCARVLVAQTTIGKALSIPPSQFWDGKDGPWSTFRIEVGTPRQQIRVLPSSDQSSTLLVLPEACGSGSSTNCEDSHGELYKRVDSTTWEEFGQYELNTFITKRIGLDGDGLYGYDALTLGWSGDNMPSLDNQSIAGIITKDFWIGSLALNPRPINFTNYNNPIPSLMQNLRNKSTDPIPSLSWSYTAGAFNRAPKEFGSLVLGGFDSTRFEPNSLTFPFGADISLDFQVAIQSISTDKPDTRLLSTPIIAYINTMVADIWLPQSVCEKFEEAFGLIWNDTSELYFLSETQHEKLLDSNPTVSFRVGPESSGGSVVIKMPYWNFYHTATSDMLGNGSSSLYFPLKRAANDTQYVLGRTFLQSAHLSADYERNTFNLSQALYPGTSTAQNIVAVLPPLTATTPGTGTGGTSGGGGNGSGSGGGGGGGGLSTGAIAGIAVGVAILFAIAGAIIFVMWRRRKRSPVKKTAELEDTDVQNTMHHEISGDGIKHEMADGDGLKHEMQGDYDPKAELYAGGDQQKPVEADASNMVIYEMPGDHLKRSELDSQTDVSKPFLSDEDHIYHQQQYQQPLQQPYQSEFAHGPVDDFLYTHQDEKGGRTPSPKR